MYNVLIIKTPLKKEHEYSFYKLAPYHDKNQKSINWMYDWSINSWVLDIPNKLLNTTYLRKIYNFVETQKLSLELKVLSQKKSKSYIIDLSNVDSKKVELNRTPLYKKVLKIVENEEIHKTNRNKGIQRKREKRNKRRKNVTKEVRPSMPK